MPTFQLVLVVFLVLAITKPALAIPALCVIVEQEASSGSAPGSGQIAAWGQVAYVSQNSQTGLHVITLISIVLAPSAFLRLSQPRLRRAAIFMLSPLAVLAVAIQFQDDPNLAGIQPFLLIWAGFIAGLLCLERESAAWFGALLCIAMTFKAVIALMALNAGQGVQADFGYPVAYYDSAVLLIGVAAAMASFMDGNQRSYLRALTILTALIVVFVSFRRASFLGACIALVVLAVIGKQKGHTRRLWLFLACAVVGTTLTVPGFYRPISYALSAGFQSLSGNSVVDRSAVDHVTDISTGLYYASLRPWTGYGVDAYQRQGLVAPSDTIYVHNEFLQAWLTLGAIGLAVVVILVAASVVVSCLALQRVGTKSVAIVTFASVILIGLLPGYGFFPHLLTLPRFALLFGWCLGVVYAASTQVASDRTIVRLSGARHNLIPSNTRPEGRHNWSPGNPSGY